MAELLLASSSQELYKSGVDQRTLHLFKKKYGSCNALDSFLHQLLHLPTSFGKPPVRSLAHLIQVAKVTGTFRIKENIRPLTSHGSDLCSNIRMLQQTQAHPRGKVHAGWILQKLRSAELLGFAFVLLHTGIYFHNDGFSSISAISALK